MKHAIVYSRPDQYAGWPANHGAWQWGDEFLVGFMRGRYDAQRSMHKIAEPFELMQARSFDGGEIWAAEVPGIPVDYAETSSPPEFSLKDSIIRVRGTYDHGGDFVPEAGGFWRSRDRGRIWHGAYAFAGLESIFSDPYLCTARTRTMGDLVFLSRAERSMWGTDSVFCARHIGERFEFVSTVCDDQARAVMPAVARIGKRIVCLMRRRSTERQGGWIDAFGSDDDGRSWTFLAEVARTGWNNGNPPALIADGDRIVCAYANRSDCQMHARWSVDGKVWSVPLVLRAGSESDIGYPQLFKRSDGQLVCVYYWSDSGEPQHIAATTFRIEAEKPCA